MVQINDNDTETNWNAIQMHNKDWDGRLYYGVKSTGIYCKPSCPSKRPTRVSVEFFFTSEDAENAGYRACKRCHPDQVDEEKSAWQKLIQIIDDPTNEVLSVEKWAKMGNISPAQLRRIIMNYVGISPKDYLAAKKVKEFKMSIQKGEDITASQFSAGFGSSSRLYEKAASRLGMTPGKYKKRGKGLKITYAIMDVPLGKLLIAATDKGVCSIQMGDSDVELVNSIKKEFSSAELLPNSGELTPWIDQIHRYFAGSNQNLDIPLELHASTFQIRVWNELRKIPFGETRSYTQVAAAIGQPTAARAVASACASNPVAIVTPCHRVIHSDGSVSGYRWGLEKKKALLMMEKSEKK
jgi:AraC family transcriptional regulator, regulatory protein of adaptative response / methylated-DNA-[protein]-cysteine methyltransferase